MKITNVSDKVIGIMGGKYLMPDESMEVEEITSSVDVLIGMGMLKKEEEVKAEAKAEAKTEPKAKGKK